MSDTFSLLDTQQKGFFEIEDLQKFIKEQGADPAAFDLQRIVNYFGNGKKITKLNFLKGIALPPWKLNEKTNKDKN